MKKLLLLTSVCALAACSHPTHKNPMFLGLFGPMEWPEQHWQGQNFEPLMTDHQNALPAAVKTNPTMFDDMAGVSPDDFIQHLKDAKIIRRVYNEKSGMIERTETGSVIIELDHNFYTLSQADQNKIGELLSRSYQKDTYILKDANTKAVVGQITSLGLHLF